MKTDFTSQSLWKIQVESENLLVLEYDSDLIAVDDNYNPYGLWDTEIGNGFLCQCPSEYKHFRRP
jgi:hypothetical protein